MNKWQLAELDKPIPPQAIETKPGRGNLSYVKGIWVEQEANRIFGPDGWSKEIVYREPVSSFTATRKNKRTNETYEVEVFRAIRGVRVTVFDDPDVVRDGDACGTGEGEDGYHNAIGEATTDAVKIALARFGRRLGAQLYFAGKYETQTVPRERVEKAIAALENEPTDETVEQVIKALGAWTLTKADADAINAALTKLVVRRAQRAARAA